MKFPFLGCLECSKIEWWSHNYAKNPTGQRTLEAWIISYVNSVWCWKIKTLVGCHCQFFLDIFTDVWKLDGFWRWIETWRYMNAGRAYSAFTSSLSMGNKESHWMAVCSCHMLIFQQLQLTQSGRESLCEGKVAPRPRDVALKIGEFTSWARYGNRDVWPLKAVLGYVKPWEKKERKGKARGKQQQKLISSWMSLACWQKVWDFAASLGHTVTSCLKNR